MQTPTVYVLGAGGQLGRALAGTRPDTAPMIALTSREADLTDPASLRAALSGLRAGDVVINAAAYTNVDAAETDRDAAFAVNAEGAAHLATVTGAAGARLIHVSTDYVFGPHTPAAAPLEPGDLDPADPPATVYGASKLAGETAITDRDPGAVIVRTAWVYTGYDGAPDFVGTMRRLERERDTVSVVDDQRGSPTYAPDLAAGLWELAGSDVHGTVLHAVNAGDGTWYDLACGVFTGLGADPQRVRPCTTDEFPRPAPRPRYSVLSGRSWAQAGLTPLRDWHDALTAALAGPPATSG
ncbi:MAG: dTDP-4-dehydrorhamnose reductase [Gordonia sp. (in: high G+C Gram-positive bacteria)]|uniref:dTDP-4-dehydrorhamnose reductase n=1 Tax=Gordonia sp. (in: high G+C Gram-positive bacteria) TaxID=84139 RepID=UPI0039E4A1E9